MAEYEVTIQVDEDMAYDGFDRLQQVLDCSDRKRLNIEAEIYTLVEKNTDAALDRDTREQLANTYAAVIGQTYEELEEQGVLDTDRTGLDYVRDYLRA